MLYLVFLLVPSQLFLDPASYGLGYALFSLLVISVLASFFGFAANIIRGTLFGMAVREIEKGG